MLNWRDSISDVLPNVEFVKPATRAQIMRAEPALGCQLPAELRDLLQETNGVIDLDAQLMFILSLERIKKDNLGIRQAKWSRSYMPFNNLLFFADAGNGDKFAFPISREGEVRRDVFAWDHEDDSRKWCAPSLLVFLQWWCEGKLKL